MIRLSRCSKYMFLLITVFLILNFTQLIFLKERITFSRTNEGELPSIIELSNEAEKQEIINYIENDHGSDMKGIDNNLHLNNNDNNYGEITGISEISRNGEFWNPKPGRNDRQILYRIYDYVSVAENSFPNSQVCIATQGSLDKLKWLPEIVHNWKGPISVAVFVPGNEWMLSSKYIEYLKNCYPEISKYATFHFVHPISKPPILNFNLNIPELKDCNFSHEIVLEKILTYRNESFEELLFPQNHLRNVARKTCLSSNVFMTDIDIIPSYGMYEELSRFLQQDQCRNCINVIPTFELDLSQKFPKTKAEIKKLVDNGLARQFHQIIYIFGHGATNYKKWLSDTIEGPVHVAYNIPTPIFTYEPFYVSPDTVPQHDERFIGYGFTRNTQKETIEENSINIVSWAIPLQSTEMKQKEVLLSSQATDYVLELIKMKYTFRVLSPIFTVHWGLHVMKEQKAWRRRQNSNNCELLGDFIKEIKVKTKKYNVRNSLSKS